MLAGDAGLFHASDPALEHADLPVWRRQAVGVVVPSSRALAGMVASAQTTGSASGSGSGEGEPKITTENGCTCVGACEFTLDAPYQWCLTSETLAGTKDPCGFWSISRQAWWDKCTDNSTISQQGPVTYLESFSGESGARCMEWRVLRQSTST